MADPAPDLLASAPPVPDSPPPVEAPPSAGPLLLRRGIAFAAKTRVPQFLPGWRLDRRPQANARSRRGGPKPPAV